MLMFSFIYSYNITSRINLVWVDERHNFIYTYKITVANY